MKKIFILAFILIFNTQFCMSDETIEDIDSYFVEQPEQSNELEGYIEYNQAINELEEEENSIKLDSSTTTGINITPPKSFSSKSLISNTKNTNFQPFKNEYNLSSKFSEQEYSIKPVSTKYSKNFGSFSFGTMYDSSLGSARVNYSTGLFSKYETKRFAFSSGFSKSTNSNYDNYNDIFYFAPELKLTKRLSLLDIMQTDVNQINKKNEIVLRYSPFLKRYADDIQLELKAGQSFYEDSYIKSSVQFSTRFKL